VDDSTRIDLETRLLFQEDTIAKLSDVIAEQQRQIDAMRDTLERIVELLERNEPGTVVVAPRSERPPHY
jgi:uncharacterized coiled-coil protein SlyX